VPLAEWGAIGNLIGVWVAGLLTLAVLSYILGDNPAYRLAQHLFVGVAAGYAAALAWNHVLAPRLIRFVQAPQEAWPVALFAVLGLMMLGRGWRPLAALAGIPLGLLMGTGAALALGGILAGTLVPQLAASFVSLAPAAYGGGVMGWALALDAAFLLFCTLAVLAAFQYHRIDRGPLRLWYRGVQGIGRFGRLVMMVAFGAILAGSALSFFAILQSRLAFLVYQWLGSLTGLGL
jgi:hypothetical protein